ncbi:MAG TPA: methyltransferase [Candidatus Binataceae bacterium]|nr:methyltransferase [Candidatus Binataceae bacterium]
MKTTESSETCDAILGGKIRVIQPRQGYRFSVDSILLVRFVSARRNERVLELGAGSGVISLAIAALHQPREIVAIEIQPELIAMIDRGAQLNGFHSIDAIEADLRKIKHAKVPPNGFDLVVANPPYRKHNSGRQSPNEKRRVARSETASTLEDFVAAAARHARGGGRAAFVFVADRFAELISIARQHRLEPKRIRFVHPYTNAPATTVLLETRKGGGVEVCVEPPLILFDAPGTYSKEARELLEEVASPTTAK